MNGETMACCPKCAEPLVCTFERPKKEFHCLGCGSWWEWLQPHGKQVTDELQARCDEITRRFRAGERGPVDLDEAVAS